MSPSNDTTPYVAFLRGINVGGVIVKMDALKKAIESLKFKNVRTLLASGNVLFETKRSTNDAISKTIEEKLKKTFGREIGVIVHSIAEIEKLVKNNPFKGVKITPDTRLYVTFLARKPKSNLKIPYKPKGANFEIIRLTSTESCSVVTGPPGEGTLDLMDLLDKEFGKKVTTRNWNTVEKVLKKFQFD
ncbi:MAG: DUF1697 domain-containing protein [Ignavibacteriae bacterium]|nr:DUF1697 domain-containing protein [Ignavibacteriota bacterium]